MWYQIVWCTLQDLVPFSWYPILVQFSWLSFMSIRHVSDESVVSRADLRQMCMMLWLMTESVRRLLCRVLTMSMRWMVMIVLLTARIGNTRTQFNVIIIIICSSINLPPQTRAVSSPLTSRHFCFISHLAERYDWCCCNSPSLSSPSAAAASICYSRPGLWHHMFVSSVIWQIQLMLLQ